ncbi:hypothetical protein L873DRAFT_1849419 [Choiromyces venosus 120613-1]|uniref:Uncharacterized protein n=1 Tax=Choiromyces venosus 120613-1 TaxID=1336337 RepID=A0A3N4IWL7_9PEZI|nr:hypothetical protein L873DRAFT_1849419 [Choiromyces venosus 120613-1]
MSRTAKILYIHHHGLGSAIAQLDSEIKPGDRVTTRDSEIEKAAQTVSNRNRTCILKSCTYITPSSIPAGCTSLVQPLDVSVNKPLKDRLRYLTNEPIFELESMAEFEKWTIRDRRIIATHCVGKAFYEFHNEKGEVIHRSFRKVGLPLRNDGSLDHELDVKGLWAWKLATRDRI